MMSLGGGFESSLGLVHMGSFSCMGTKVRCACYGVTGPRRLRMDMTHP